MADALTCAESEEMLALAALGVLPSADSAEVEHHLAGCATCRETSRAYQRATFALPESLDLLAPRAELRRQLLTAVYSSAAGGRLRRRRLRSLWQLIPQSRAATLVAAAGVAAAVVLGVWGATRSTAPPAQTFPVMATTYAPAVQGDVTYYASTARTVVSVSGLPEPPAGSGLSVFVLWLIPQAGSPTPAAFLTRAPQGAVWTAVVRGDLSRYKSLAATAETNPAANAPSGPEVFSVTIHP
jgi:anti-sigma-K factor RskA